MAGTYEVLAPIYDIIGMSDFAQRVTMRLINFAQQNDWLGRRILEFGCGTGGSAVTLCKNGFTVTGVDNAGEMLQVAQSKLDDSARPLFRPIQQDIRVSNDLPNVDMVLALDLLNEMESLRDVERMFNKAASALDSGRLFIVDMHTIEGLAQRAQIRDRLINVNSDSFMVFTQDQYDYDRQIDTRRYIVFTAQGALWKHEEATRMLRAYPVQAIASLLQRSSFNIMRAFNGDMEVFDPSTSSTARVIFVAQKQ